MLSGGLFCHSNKCTGSVCKYYVVWLDVNNMLLCPCRYVIVSVNDSEVLSLENGTLLFVNILEFLRDYSNLLSSKLHSLDSHLYYNFH